MLVWETAKPVSSIQKFYPLYNPEICFVTPVLGRKDASGSWTANVLSSFHNAKDHAEVARMHEDHPLEDPVVNERVLGALSVTRGIYICYQPLVS